MGGQPAAEHAHTLATPLAHVQRVSMNVGRTSLRSNQADRDDSKMHALPERRLCPSRAGSGVLGLWRLRRPELAAVHPLLCWGSIMPAQEVATALAPYASI